MRGMAADIKVDGMKAKELAKKLDEIVPNECGIIVYDNWVHLTCEKEKNTERGCNNGTDFH